jgi:dihydroorotate dehydrogenase electron transfer subunit
MQADATIVRNRKLKKDVFEAVFESPEIARDAQPGQFVHLRIAELRDRVLRRPFSICDAEDGRLTIVYKVVGEGTETMSALKPGAVCNLMGPLGNGFSLPEPGLLPLIVAGGYGAAATHLLARRCPMPGTLLLGARNSDDLILIEHFLQAGFDVLTSTDDGSAGHCGRVTDLLSDFLAANPADGFRVYACGPLPMLLQTGKDLLCRGMEGELSLDHAMCCGVGACYACVVRVKADTPAGWRYARTCKEGPVFPASQVYYG